MRVTEVPDNLALSNDVFSYRSHYLFDPSTNVIQVKRTFDARFGKQVCKRDEFRNAQPMLKQIECDT